jgi:four helix bundle protein
MSSYRDLDVWKLARALATDIHATTLQKLPKFEMHEEGSQIRRSAKSIRSNIVEGYGRRRYKQEFIKFLVSAHSSCDETMDHLESLLDAQSLKDRALFDDLQARLDELGRKLNRFVQGVEREHQSEKQVTMHPASRVPYPTSP